MTIAFNIYGVNGFALLNAGLGAMRVAMGESADLTFSSPSTCYIEGDSNEGGGFLRALEEGRLDSAPLLADRVPNSTGQLDLETINQERNEWEDRQISAVDHIRAELGTILDLTSGSLRIAVDTALQVLQRTILSNEGEGRIRRIPILHVENGPSMTPDQINALITNIRARTKRPEFQAYAAALERHNEAHTAFISLHGQLTAHRGPFPPDELRGLLESLWHANWTVWSLQQEMSSLRQIVIEVWRKRDDDGILHEEISNTFLTGEEVPWPIPILKTVDEVADARGLKTSEERQRQIGIINSIREELDSVTDLTSGRLGAEMQMVLRSLETHKVLLGGRSLPRAQNTLFMSYDEINRFLVRIREKMRLPEFRAYSRSLERFQEEPWHFYELRDELQNHRQAVIAAWRED